MFGMDSDTLIKLTKARAKEAVTSSTDIIIPPEVVREAVDEGKEGGFPDAFEIEQNIEKGALRVVETIETEDVETIIKKLGLKGGEADVFRLFKAGKCEAVASDDQKFLDLISAMNIPHVTPSALLILAWREGTIDKETCRELLKKLKSVISDGEYQTALFELEGGD